MQVHYYVYQPPDESWPVAALCDEPMPAVVTVRRDHVTCPDCLKVLGMAQPACPGLDDCQKLDAVMDGECIDQVGAITATCGKRERSVSH